jgi:hypothetical protein
MKTRSFNKSSLLKIGRSTLGAALMLSLTAPLDAWGLEFDNPKMSGSFDTTVTVGLGMRLENPDPSNVGIGNGGTYPTLNEDNGNLNYRQGSFYSKVVKSTHELQINYDDKWSIFSRATGLYDFDVMRDYKLRTDFSNSAKDDLGHELKFLDAYWKYDTELGNNPVTFKVGNQVLSWGESTFIQNGINSINPFDVSKFRVAGAELRDGLLPIPMAVLSVEMTDVFSFEIFKQWSHRKTKIDPEGSLFSDNDFVSPGSTYAHIGRGIGTDLDGHPCVDFATCSVLTDSNGDTLFGQTARQGSGPEPEDSNNMGIAFKWLVPQLDYTEFGFYAMNYTSRLPAISGFQGPQSAAVAGTALGVGGLAAALNPATPFAALPAESQALLNTAYTGAQLGAFGADLRGKTQAGLTVSDLQADLVDGLARVGRLGTASQSAAATGGNLAAAIGGRATEILGGIYIPNSYYFLEYPEDIKMLGLSFNTTVKGLALQGEISYKNDQPIQIDDEVLLAAALGAPGQLGVFQTAGGAGVIRGWNPKNVTQGQMTFTKLLGRKYGSDNMAVVGEVAYTKIHGMEAQSVLRYEAPGTAYGTGYGESFSWGYRLFTRADYYNFFEEISIHPSFAFNHDVNGTTPKPIGNFVEDRKWFTLAIEAKYQNEYAAKIAYTNFLGDDIHHTSRDRDFVTLAFSRFF